MTSLLKERVLFYCLSFENNGNKYLVKPKKLNPNSLVLVSRDYRAGCLQGLYVLS